MLWKKLLKVKIYYGQKSQFVENILDKKVKIYSVEKCLKVILSISILASFHSFIQLIRSQIQTFHPTEVIH